MTQVFYKLSLIVLGLSLSSCVFGLDDKTSSLPQGKIVFESATGIYTIDPDGTNLVQLTTHGSQPTWSPDGQQIAFTSTLVNSNLQGIFIMNADGSNVQLLPIDPGPGMPLYVGQQPVWSPDGDRIAYYHDNGEAPGSAIFIATLSSRELLQLSNANPGISDRFPVWSPDGTRIAFLSNRDNIDQDRTQDDIYVMDGDGKNGRKLTAIGDVWGFRWNPNGETLAFVKFQRVGSKRSLALYLVGVDGSNLQQVSDAGENVFGLAWDRAGNRIAYSFNGEIRLTNIMTMKTVKVEVKSITGLEFFPGFWSPDERELLVTSRPKDDAPSSNRFYLDMIEIESGKWRRLLPDDSIRSVEWFQE